MNACTNPQHAVHAVVHRQVVELAALRQSGVCFADALDRVEMMRPAAVGILGVEDEFAALARRGQVALVLRETVQISKEEKRVSLDAVLKLDMLLAAPRRPRPVNGYSVAMAPEAATILSLKAEFTRLPRNEQVRRIPKDLVGEQIPGAGRRGGRALVVGHVAVVEEVGAR